MKITSYIRQLLHLDIRDHCLLGRLITLDINIITSNTSDDRELETLHINDEIIIHTTFHNKYVLLIDPFQRSYCNKITAYNVIFSSINISNVITTYQCYTRGEEETISITSNNIDDYNSLKMMKRSSTWYSGKRRHEVYKNNRYDIFNSNNGLIKIITRKKPDDPVVMNVYHDYNHITYTLEDKIFRNGDNSISTYLDDNTKNDIIQCIHLVEEDMKNNI